MKNKKPDIVKLYQNLKRIVDAIPVDFGGGAPISKTLLMSYIMLMHDFKNYVEIGVYKGRSFFPLAYTAKLSDGTAYGIDAYDNETAKEFDLTYDFGKRVNDFIDKVDFSRIYEDVKDTQERLELTSNSVIIKDRSSSAISYFKSKNISIDMLHIDGNHDTIHAMEDVDLYVPLIRSGGFIVLDDIDWDSVKPVYQHLKEKNDLIFNNGLFAIFQTRNSKNKTSTLQRYRIKKIYQMANNATLDNMLSTPVDILIIDDAFPHPHSAFRMQEFLGHLKNFGSIKILSDGIASPILGPQQIEGTIAEFIREYPHHSTQIGIIKQGLTVRAKLVYMIFLNIAYRYISIIEKAKIPFVFTLYPRGGFRLNDKMSDMMLKKVTSSKYFKKVIVTQKTTYDYLIEKNFCRPDQIEYIFGMVTHHYDENYGKDTKKHYYGVDKNTLDICFVAHKYTEKGKDKGYDVFLNVAEKLSSKHENIKFHVVGGFTPETIHINNIKEKVFFYGSHPTNWFDKFYKDKDIILSPNAPHLVFDGSFDGFPTGTCVDAGLRKTAVFCTDDLRLNNYFVDKEDIVIIPHNAEQIVEIIESYLKKPKALQEISEKGFLKFKSLFSYETQMLPRFKILTSLLEATSGEKKIVFKTQRQQLFQEKVINVLRKISPLWLKGLFHRVRQIIK